MRGSIGSALCVVAVALVCAACGSSSTSSSTAAQSSISAPTDSQQHARLELAKCLRAHGINVPDSAVSGTPGAGAEVRQLLQQYSRSQLQGAISDCHAELIQAFPQLNLSPSEIAQRQREALAYVECLRAHGISGIPDPVANGLRVGIVKALSSIDTSSPAFQKANTACANVRPTRLAGGGG
ncbi:MAG TPA: hypothetical protein VMD48_01460 [Solirubrobacteraceae bacterium]|nr:hypothetical protein [Solirubrobacteraceae bacterium]